MKYKSPLHFCAGFCFYKSGVDLLSRDPAVRLSLAQAGLTAVFGMGTGGTPPLWTPETLIPAAMASRSSSRSRRETFKICTEKNFQCRNVIAVRSVYQNFRAISTGQLHTLRRFHLRPINVVVYHDSSPLRD